MTNLAKKWEFRQLQPVQKVYNLPELVYYTIGDA